MPLQFQNQLLSKRSSATTMSFGDPFLELARTWVSNELLKLVAR